VLFSVPDAVGFVMPIQNPCIPMTLLHNAFSVRDGLCLVICNILQAVGGFWL